jgi:hypothetical protein
VARLLTSMIRLAAECRPTCPCCTLTLLTRTADPPLPTTLMRPGLPY